MCYMGPLCDGDNGRQNAILCINVDGGTPDDAALRA